MGRVPAGTAVIAEMVAAELAGFDGPYVEDAIFGSHDPSAVAQAVAAFCRAELGAEPTRCIFYEASVGSVAGVELADGRRVVVKAHQPDVPREYLAAAARVQETLAARGFPCPRPLVGPRALGYGIATVEELIDDGRRADAHEPPVRRAMAAALASLVESARDLCAIPGLRPGLLSRRHGLWPKPHSRMFDFEATAAGAEWIDEAAGRALAILDRGGGPPVVGHVDWSVKHFRFLGGEVRVVYDWDSLAVVDEARLVGEAARGFTATWYLDVPLTPSPEEARAFVAEYEDARGRSFDRAERERVGAAALYGLAYSARCEACGGEPPRPGGFREALSRHADEFLRLVA